MNNIQNYVLEYVYTTNQKHRIHTKQTQNPNFLSFLIHRFIYKKIAQKNPE